jgi:hypothetical protein
MIDCTCEICGISYTKPKDFNRLNKKNHNVFFDWSLRFCDKHRKEKELKALKKLPKVLKSILNKKESEGL